MNWLEEWFDRGKGILLNPEEFYRKLPEKNVKYLLKFALTSALIGAVLTSLIKIIFSSISTPVIIWIVLLSAVIGGIIGGIFGLLLNSGIIHIFVYLFGGKDFNKTLNVVAYPIVFQAFFGWVPIVGGMAAGIYTLYAEIRGLEKFHNFSTEKAAASVLIPAAIGLVVITIAMFMFYEDLSQIPTQSTLLNNGNF